MPSVVVVAWKQGRISLLQKKQALHSFSGISSVIYGKAVNMTHEEVMQAMQERIDRARDKPC